MFGPCNVQFEHCVVDTFVFCCCEFCRLCKRGNKCKSAARGDSGFKLLHGLGEAFSLNDDHNHKITVFVNTYEFFSHVTVNENRFSNLYCCYLCYSLHCYTLFCAVQVQGQLHQRHHQVRRHGSAGVGGRVRQRAQLNIPK